MLKFFDSKLDYFIRTPSEWIINKLVSGEADLPVGLNEDLGQNVTQELGALINPGSESNQSVQNIPSTPVKVNAVPCMPEDAPKVVKTSQIIEKTTENATQAVVVGQQLLEQTMSKPHICEQFATDFNIQSEGLVDTCKAVVDTQGPVAQFLNISDKTLLGIEGGFVAGGLLAVLGYYLLSPSKAITLAVESKEESIAKAESKKPVRDNVTWDQTHGRAALSELDKALIPFYNRAEKIAVVIEGQEGRQQTVTGIITPDWKREDKAASVIGDEISKHGHRL